MKWYKVIFSHTPSLSTVPSGWLAQLVDGPCTLGWSKTQERAFDNLVAELGNRAASVDKAGRKILVREA